MDEAVDQVMGRSSDEKGADKAVAVRRSQQKERARLQSEIQAEQKTITALGEEAAPLRAEFRKVEAEVGPIKYIAALIYGDEASQTMLEAAVRWVIILIVVVFDPLALCLILAANKQLEWARKGQGGWVHDEKPKEEEKSVEEPKEPEPEPVVEQAKDPESPVDLGNCPKCNTAIVDAPEIGPMCPNNACDVFDNVEAERDRIEEEEAERKLQEFFTRARLRARALDAEEAERMAEEANAALADIEPETSDLDTVVEQAQAIETLEKERNELIDALIELGTERDAMQDQLSHVLKHQADLEQEFVTLPIAVKQAEEAKQALEQQLVEVRAAKQELALELENTITAMYANESFLAVTEEEKEILRGRVTELETQTAQQQEWIEQLEQDLREAIRVAQEATQAVPELETTNLVADNDITGVETVARFGTEFPKDQRKGDVFMRVDYTPNRLFKWNGAKWIEMDKNNTDRYAYDQAYIQLLVGKLQRGEYDFDDLNEAEKAQINEYLNQPNVQ